MIRLVLYIAIGWFFIGRSEAGIFQLAFDDTATAVLLDGNIVGTGTVSWTGPNIDGTFPVLSLPDFDLFFQFGPDTFTLSDATTPLSEVLVLVSGGGTELFFSNNGATSGGFNGAIDFVDADMSNPDLSVLSFEPPGFSPPPPSLYYVGNIGSATYFGDYGVVDSSVVPEPTALSVWAFLAATGFVLPRRNRRQCVIT